MLKYATRHAQTRMQQRGIGATAVKLLLRFGNSIHDHHGGEIIYMDRRGRKALRSQAGRSVERRYDKALNTYLVIGRDGQIITVGKRYRKLVRH